MGVDRKSDLIRGLGDVVVVPECRSDPRLATEPDVNFQWSGVWANKGLGIFAFGGWKLAPMPEAGARSGCLPVAVFEPTGAYAFDLLGIWTKHDYIREFADILDVWQDRLRHPQLVIAGDLNDSMRPSAAGVSSANLGRLNAHGLRSAYHEHFCVAPGGEGHNTTRWIGRGRIPYYFHIDFVFLSADLRARLTAAEVGSMADWVEGGQSDHCPVVATLSGRG